MRHSYTEATCSPCPNQHSTQPHSTSHPCAGLDLTFHRAFDVVRDQRQALDDLITCGWVGNKWGAWKQTGGNFRDLEKFMVALPICTPRSLPRQQPPCGVGRADRWHYPAPGSGGGMGGYCQCAGHATPNPPCPLTIPFSPPPQLPERPPFLLSSPGTKTLQDATADLSSNLLVLSV